MESETPNEDPLVKALRAAEHRSIGSSVASHLIEAELRSRKNKTDFSKLIYMLQGSYEPRRINADTLEESDRHHTVLLAHAAEQCGLSLGLASLKWSIRQGRTVVFDMVDGNGDLLTSELVYVKGSECTIPANLRSCAMDVFARGDPDNEAEHLVLYRAAVVLWPRGRHDEAVLEPNCIVPILKILGRSGEAPEAFELRLFKHILRTGWQDTDISDLELLRSLSTLAGLWEDSDSWHQVLELCNGTEGCGKLGIEGIVSAIDDFGYDTVFPVIDRMLRTEPSNAIRFHLLDEIEDTFENVITNKWTNVRRQFALRDLQPLVEGDPALIMRVARKTSGAAIIQKAISRLQMNQAAPGTLLKLVLELDAEFSKAHGMFRSPEAMDICLQSIDRLLSGSIASTNFYYNTSEGPRTALQHIEACIETGNSELIPAIVKKLLKVPTKSSAAVQQVLLPLLWEAPSLLKGKPPEIVKSLQPLYKKTIFLFLREMRRGMMVTRGLVSMVIGASITFGGSEFRDEIIPKAKALASDASTYLAFIKELHARRDDLKTVLHEDVHNMIAGLFDSMFSKLEFRSCTPDLVITLLDYCYDVESPESCNQVLAEIYKINSQDPQLVESHLEPLIHLLCALLIRREIASTSQPYRDFFHDSVFVWFVQVLKAKPRPLSLGEVDALYKLHTACGCEMCQAFIASLTEDQPDVDISSNKHLDGLITWEIGSISEDGNRVLKSDHLREICRWNARILRAKRLVDAISTDAEELNTIFGDDGDLFVRTCNAIIDLSFDALLAVQDTPAIEQDATPSFSFSTFSTPAAGSTIDLPVFQDDATSHHGMKRKRIEDEGDRNDVKRQR